MREISSPLDGFASPFGPQRGFNPLRIFANDEPGVWFEANDANTLFTDVAGTTPVTTPGDAVALQLDKSQGLTLGPELADLSTATVSDFDESAGVIDAVNSRFENTSATTSLGTYPRIIWSALLTPGKTYEVDVVAERLTAVGTGGTGGNNVVVSGSFSGKLVAGSNGNIFFGFDGRETFDVAVSISVRELPGNHRTQATTAARPLYALHPVGGVRNLLQYTEEFDEWVAVNGTVTADARAAPDGSITADDFQATGTSRLRRSVNLTVGESYTLSFYAYHVSGPKGFVRVANTGTFSSAYNTDLVTGEWVRIERTFTAENATEILDIGRDQSTSDLISYWGAQLEEGPTATNYQRVGSFLDVSEEGKARRGRIWYNGTSHFMQTGTITPGTDKVQVFAGVRKLSDAARGMLVEFSNTLSLNNGALYIAAPEVPASKDYNFVTKGTTGRGAQAVSQIAPTTNILTGLGDISGDRSTLRVDGTQVAQNTGDQGAGNYLAYPIYFGARAGTSLFFNGYEDTSIIRFGPNLDASVIGKVESYVASKTPEPTL